MEPESYLDIIIVNWNSGSQLSECVIATMHENVNFRIIVVDNGSSDHSIDLVKDIPEVEIIYTGKNLGFAAACNLGASTSSSPYLLFLNPDTRIEPNALFKPLTFMESPENENVGICGAQLFNEDCSVSRTCARFPTLTRLTASTLGIDRLPRFHKTGVRMIEWDHGDCRAVDQVMGAFFFIRRKVFQDCNGFDERFFVYFEEVDLAKRAMDLGWESWYLSGARAFHAGGGTSQQVKARRLFYSLRSRLLYGFKHFPRWQAWLLVVVTCVFEPFTRTIWCLGRGDGEGVHQTWAAYKMLWPSIQRIARNEGRFEP